MRMQVRVKVTQTANISQVIAFPTMIRSVVINGLITLISLWQLSLAFYHPTLSPVSETLYRVHPPAPAFCNITNSSTTSANSALNQCEAAIRVPVNLSNLVGSGTDGRVWQGTLSDNASPIAVKSFRTKEAALKEAEFYENAPSTLSNLIPEYFGLYARRDQSWFVLVMEDVGKSLDKIGWNWRDVKTKLESDSWYDDS